MQAQQMFVYEHFDAWRTPTTPDEVDAFIGTVEAAWADDAGRTYPGYKHLLSPTYAFLSQKVFDGYEGPFGEEWQERLRLACYLRDRHALPLLANELTYLQSEPGPLKAFWLINIASTAGLRDQCHLSDAHRALLDSLRGQLPTVLDTYVNATNLADSLKTRYVYAAFADLMDTVGKPYLVPLEAYEARILDAHGLSESECPALLKRHADRPEAQLVTVHLVDAQPGPTSLEMTLPGSQERLFLQREPLFDLSSVKNVYTSSGSVKDSRPSNTISIDFTDEGRACLHHLTQIHRGKRLGVVLNNQLIRAPRLIAVLPDGAFPLLETPSKTLAQQLLVDITGNVERLHAQE